MILLNFTLDDKDMKNPFCPATTRKIEDRGREDQPGYTEILQKETVESEAKEKLELVHCWNRTNGKLTFTINFGLRTLTHMY